MVYIIALVTILLALFFVWENKSTKTYMVKGQGIVTTENKLYLIISGLTVGFLLNFILAIILSNYMNSINIDDFNGIKDIMFIVVMLFAIPLLTEYSK